MNKIMKNIQIIDAGENCAYDLYSLDVELFNLIFQNNTNIAFIDQIIERFGLNKTNDIMDELWKNPIKKHIANGIHGTIFYELENKKQFYPNLRESDLDNWARPWRHG